MAKQADNEIPAANVKCYINIKTITACVRYGTFYNKNVLDLTVENTFRRLVVFNSHSD